ncbi:hypothetical protein DOTSEDRAFT_24084 [Dothistroma septosporum NZE10]|uniref:C2H2-type domain-containing protein n=1 Tax=Dothistroma septosporum (strain NZE10 / CBS 128990) TaxID=675120 RepID=N1PNL6_DOTSN|nr:hypothetical protein DOTSEDRAFT_24084 [Dothistroma septosporum NZE10]
MSSPSYSEQDPVSLSSPSTDSRGDLVFPFDDPVTPQTEQYPFEFTFGSELTQDWPQVHDHGIDDYGNDRIAKASQLGDFERDFSATTSGCDRSEGSWLEGNGIHEATLYMTSEPFPHRILAEQHASTIRPSAQVICNRCQLITTITAQPGHQCVTIPVPAYCEACLMAVTMEHDDHTLQRSVPIPKQQHRRSGPAPVAKPVFRCDIDGCTTTCKRSHDLSRHKLRQHRLSGVYYQCDACGTIIYRDDKMRQHCRKQHGQNFGDEQYGEVAE